ncbi:ChuX/HutX family heme-like substrate-binding protein [Halomonas dongshanensis]|uniref:Heme degradation protein n=1 Tax=Halomonas dongshanensis TaxID=2890835 RepID=A0ABT2E9C7_9GAMM|nr:ChuX/HutX family heme-like substrate-binding protein [Halomonas dongshanensis]MCS2608185.1 heme degradation protein [Halomonas dongshanensis]
MTCTLQQTAIQEAIDAGRSARPRLPVISIAQRLDISEGELQAARLGRDVWTLPLSPHALAACFAGLGRVKSMTRSSLAVLEQQGDYPELRGGECSGLLLDPGGLDLRLLYGYWHWACLIRDAIGDGDEWRWSVQIFDRHGRAVHKCFALESPLPRAWGYLAAQGTLDAPAFTQMAPILPRPLPEVPSLADEWAAMKDVHHFFGLLKRHRLERQEAHTLMQGRFTHALAPQAIETLLTQASQQALPLMLFVASPGCVHIHTGALPLPQRTPGWLSLFGERFTLHLDDAAIARAWIVEKPNRDGGVTSVEAFDEYGELVLQIYAERQEGQRERAAWRHLLSTLRTCEAVA